VTPAPRGRPSTAFLLLAGGAVVASIALRLALLGRQSYWGDELYSVNASTGSLPRVLAVSATEVHPPLYATLLWSWIKIGGTGEAWTRLFSTVCALAAVPVAHRGLRAVRLGDHVRWALTVATAAGATSIVYSLETRSYALLTLASVGLTVSTLRASLMILDGGAPGRRARLAWFGWSLLAATVHLFGAILTLGALTVLVGVTVLVGGGVQRVAASVARWAALAVAGCSLQAAWLLWGMTRPGFASGTTWIVAPRAQDVWDLVTTTFGSGGMTPHKDGFAWTSPLGAVSAATLGLAAAVAGRLVARRSRPAPSPRAGRVEWQAAAILLALTAVVVAGAFGVSQWKHLWTLRNMVVAAPALMWGVICLAAGAAGAGCRRAVATAAVVLLGLGLVPTAVGAWQPYKTDFRALDEYLVTAWARQPDVTVVLLGPFPEEWRTAGGLRPGDPALTPPGRTVTMPPGTPADGVPRLPGTEIVIFYHGVSDPEPNREVSALVSHLGATSCRSVPVYGLGVVRCG
jgi:hypothetical protein